MNAKPVSPHAPPVLVLLITALPVMELRILASCLTVSAMKTALKELSLVATTKSLVWTAKRMAATFVNSLI